MKKIIFISFLALILNFIWEISHSFLYVPHYVGISEMIKVHLRASMGDILLVFIVLTLDILIFGNVYERNSIQRLLIMAFFGFVLATMVEKYALFVGRWAYSPLMPIIPWLNVGLTPILQMTLIPPSIVVFNFWLKSKH